MEEERVRPPEARRYHYKLGYGSLADVQFATELALMRHGSAHPEVRRTHTLEALEALAASGLSIALDDFGTGFASLTHLKSLPISCVKIDRSFVANIMADAQSRSIVDAVSRLSHSLGKSVVAEGVEDAQQLAAVRELGCDVAQGYLFSKPIPAEDVPTFLLRHAVQRPEWREGDEPASESTLKRAS